MALPFKLQFRLEARNDLLKKAPQILATEMRGGLRAIGKRLTTSASLRMRNDSGESIRSLRTEIEGQGLGLNVVVFSTLLKAFIDAYGMRPGTRVPYGFGTRLNTWAARRVNFGPSRSRTRTGTYFPRKGRKQQLFHGHTLSRVTATTKVKGTHRIKNVNTNINRLAFLVSRSIFQRGIKASGWNRKALEANRAQIIQDLKNAVSRAANKIKQG